MTFYTDSTASFAQFSATVQVRSDPRSKWLCWVWTVNLCTSIPLGRFHHVLLTVGRRQESYNLHCSKPRLAKALEGNSGLQVQLLASAGTALKGSSLAQVWATEHV